MVSPNVELLVRAVNVLCEEHGYGRVMQLVSLIWGNKAKSEGTPGLYHVVGPCGGETVKCGCEDKASCGWCAGSGWVTKLVARIKSSDISCLKRLFDEYREFGRLSSGFVEAMLRNSFSDTMMYADESNEHNLKSLYTYMHRNLPGDCWGNSEAVDRWVAHKGLSGLSETERRRYT
jgi:hypothetical protein